MIKENYGRPLMRKLVNEARSLGLKINANRDLDGIWTIIIDGTEHIIPMHPGAAGACWCVRGMILAAKSRLSLKGQAVPRLVPVNVNTQFANQGFGVK